MTIKTLLLLGLTTLTLGTAKAQDAPFIKGEVKISIKKGTVACDFVLTNLPRIKNYVIRLNSGLNIHYFKDLPRSNDPLYYDMETRDSIGSDEIKSYYLHENRGNPARYIPDTLEVKYLGMYPVVPDSAAGWMGQDWRGNIAFNGYSIRAEGLQCDWYPELYDMDKKRLYNEVMYDIHVSCEDCSVLFVNGASPKKASSAEFKNDFPCEMSMYCGNFQTVENHGIWILNSDLPKADEQRFFATATSYQQYYNKLFGIPFKGSLSFIQTDPVADPKSWAFAFNSSPTTFNVGAGKYGLSALFRGSYAERSKQVMAHELAHYYFGTLLTQHGVLGPVIEEGFAEYLSYDLTQHLQGDSAYWKLLKAKVEALQYLSNYQPLSLVKTEKDYGNREFYLYYYAPVLYLAIRKEIGEPAMVKWLKAMINSHSETTDYPFLLTTLRSALGDASAAEKINAKYFSSTDALKNAKEELGIH